MNIPIQGSNSHIYLELQDMYHKYGVEIRFILLNNISR